MREMPSYQKYSAQWVGHIPSQGYEYCLLIVVGEYSVFIGWAERT